MEQTPAYRDIDLRFADFICSRGGGGRELKEAACRLSASVGQGHICLDLLEAFGEEAAPGLVAALRRSGVVGAPGQFRPLILDNLYRLYLYRYWKYESDLASALRAMAQNRPELDLMLLKDGLGRLFDREEGGTDWQLVAAAAALAGRFSVISGGPGTGKTATVVKIIALLLEQSLGRQQRIALAAPTGKAAARLKDSIRSARERLKERTDVAEALPGEVTTIHRLLGVIPGSSRFRHNRDNRLPCEVVIIDEASMVPLPLMARVMEALAPDCRLILLGDRDQLSSVEAGAVLGDICDTGRLHSFSERFSRFAAEVAGQTIERDQLSPALPLLADALVVLQKNYRFGCDSGIGAISRAINDGEGSAALEGLKSGSYPDVSLVAVPDRQDLEGRLKGAVLEGYREYLLEEEPARALRLFDRFRVLCAMRQGSYGVSGINQVIQACLAAEGLIAPGRKWYRGRPVMVMVNDYGLKLFNGDIGITLPDPDKRGQLAVFFPAADGGVRRVSPLRLPEHETVFAMTIHKSQGSEFERLLMIMPPFDSQLLTREILYTGLTRARTAVELWCPDQLFIAMVGRRIARRSGLRQALWGGADEG
jgi:exodeoxyribonuclease V alpha subunit